MVQAMRDLATAAQRESVDAGDHRLAQILDSVDDGLPLMRVFLGRNRRVLRQLADVGARDEGLLARAGEDDDAHLGIVLGSGERLLDLLHGGHIQRIEHLGPVDGDVGDLVFLFD